MQRLRICVWGRLNGLRQGKVEGRGELIITRRNYLKSQEQQMNMKPRNMGNMEMPDIVVRT